MNYLFIEDQSNIPESQVDIEFKHWYKNLCTANGVCPTVTEILEWHEDWLMDEETESISNMDGYELEALAEEFGSYDINDIAFHSYIKKYSENPENAREFLMHIVRDLSLCVRYKLEEARLVEGWIMGVYDFLSQSYMIGGSHPLYIVSRGHFITERHMTFRQELAIFYGVKDGVADEDYRC